MIKDDQGWSKNSCGKLVGNPVLFHPNCNRRTLWTWLTFRSACTSSYWDLSGMETKIPSTQVTIEWSLVSKHVGMKGGNSKFHSIEVQSCIFCYYAGPRTSTQKRWDTLGKHNGEKERGDAMGRKKGETQRGERKGRHNGRRATGKMMQNEKCHFYSL